MEESNMMKEMPVNKLMVRMGSLIHKLIALNYHRRILFTEIFSYSHESRFLSCLMYPGSACFTGFPGHQSFCLVSFAEII